ncbi:hypothetical protein GF402_07975 [Candidatus Fermentibacteria bacterium]|nr:hypothetical protein [Candidatus Fermentibacteria bacterium]
MILLAVISPHVTELRLAKSDGGEGGLASVSSYRSDSLDNAEEMEGAILEFLEGSKEPPRAAAVCQLPPIPGKTEEEEHVSRAALKAMLATDRVLTTTPAAAVAKSVACGCMGEPDVPGKTRGPRVVIHAQERLDAAMALDGKGIPRSLPLPLADPVYAEPTQLDFLCYLCGSMENPTVGDVLSSEGVQMMYAYLRDQIGYHEPAWMARLVRHSGGVMQALRSCVESDQRTCRLAAATARLLGSLLRTEAVNTAVRAGAKTGAVLCGGMVETAAAASDPGWPRNRCDGSEPRRNLLPFLPVRAPERCTRIDGLNRLAAEELVD